MHVDLPKLCGVEKLKGRGKGGKRRMGRREGNERSREEIRRENDGRREKEQ